MLGEVPVCIPVFFALCGTGPTEGCLIERLETRAFTFEAPVCAANHWLTPGRVGRLRTATSPQRLDSLRACMETARDMDWRSEEHTSELQSLMRISYAVFCLKKKKDKKNKKN